MGRSMWSSVEAGAWLKPVECHSNSRFRLLWPQASLATSSWSWHDILKLNSCCGPGDLDNDFYGEGCHTLIRLGSCSQVGTPEPRTSRKQVFAQMHRS